MKKMIKLKERKERTTEKKGIPYTKQNKKYFLCLSLYISGDRGRERRNLSFR